MRPFPSVVLMTAVLASAASAQAPADAATATARLNASPRHGEWVRYDAGGGDSVRAWVVFPERRDRAPVVVVIHEIFGLTDWVRAVADAAAAEGFIAIAPDLLSGRGPGGAGSEAMDQQTAVRLIREVRGDEVARRLIAAGSYATRLPAALPLAATIGFCWGGSASFNMSTVAWPALRAAVVYYGSAPDSAGLRQVRVPVLGLYGSEDARVNATIDRARGVLGSLSRRYDVEMYEGAGHGFLRDQAGREGANRRAAEAAWPRTIAFLRETLGR